MPPRSVYLDQNVYGAMLDAGGDWRASPYGKVLIDATSTGKAEVWVSPTHVLELMLINDSSRMQTLARMMLDLSAHRRMLRSYEFEVVEWMLLGLGNILAGSVRDRTEVEFRSLHVQTASLGALALMGLGVRPPQQTIDQVVMTKLVNRVIAARGLADLDGWIAAMKAAVAGKSEVLFALVQVDESDRSVLLAELATLELQAEKLRAASRGRLQKERKNFVRAYSAWSIAEAYVAVFRSRLFTEVTLDLDALVGRWASLYTEFRSRPIPEGEADARSWVLREVVRGMGEQGLVPATIAAEVYFLDWERSATEGKPPTDGLTFDMDHGALALCNADIFVTRDTKLRDLCTNVSKQMRECGIKAASVAGSPEELASLL